VAGWAGDLSGQDRDKMRPTTHRSETETRHLAFYRRWNETLWVETRPRWYGSQDHDWDVWWKPLSTIIMDSLNW